MIRKFIKFTLLVFISVDLVAIVFLSYLTFGARGAADSKSQVLIDFEIESGQGAKKISRNLEESGIISNDLFFNYYLWGKGSANLLQAGEYELSPSMTIPHASFRKFLHFSLQPAHALNRRKLSYCA